MYKIFLIWCCMGACVFLQAMKREHKIGQELSHKKVKVDTAVSKALLDAVQKGDSSAVIRLLSEGAAVNAQDDKGCTALMLATKEGDKEIVELLIKAQADINAQDDDGNSVLMTASFHNHKELSELLIAAGADINARNKLGETALMRGSELEVVALLLKHSAQFTGTDMQRLVVSRLNTGSPESRTLLFYCCTMPELRLYRDGPLSYAQWHKEHCLEKGKYIRHCQVNPLACYLLKKEISHHPDCSHLTVLMWACMLGHKEAVEELLKVDLPLWYLNAQDKYGRTALMYVLIYGHFNIVQLLAQTYERKIEDARTLLEQEADSTKRTYFVQELEKAKRAINICDKEGKSALAYALKKEDKEIAHRLIQAGVRPNIQQIKQLAEYGQYNTLLQLILKGFISIQKKKE